MQEPAYSAFRQRPCVRGLPHSTCTPRLGGLWVRRPFIGVGLGVCAVFFAVSVSSTVGTEEQVDLDVMPALSQQPSSVHPCTNFNYQL